MGIPQKGIVGSNPILSATLTRKNPTKRTLRAFASRNAFAGVGKVGGKKRFCRGKTAATLTKGGLKMGNAPILLRLASEV